MFGKIGDFFFFKTRKLCEKIGRKFRKTAKEKKNKSWKF